MAAKTVQGEAGFVTSFGQIAEALGTRNFHSTILDVLLRDVPSDFGQVYHIARDGKTTCIDPGNTPKPLCNSYEQTFSALCPLTRHWQSTGRPGVVTLNQVRDRDADYGNYFSEFYHPAGLVDEIGLLLPSPGQRTIALFLERGGQYSAESQDLVRSYFAGILRMQRANNKLIYNAAVANRARNSGCNAVALFDRAGRPIFANRQWRLATREDHALANLVEEPSNNFETDAGELIISDFEQNFPLAPGGRLCILRQAAPSTKLSMEVHKAKFLANVLSKREHEIVSCIIEGYPTKLIAERLNCAPETVKAHKKRIYARLDITTEREIFLMFIDHLRGHTSNEEAPRCEPGYFNPKLSA